MKKPRTEVNARRAAVAAEAQARAIQDDCLQQAIANESATRAESDRNLLLLVSNADLNSDLIRDPFDAEAIGRTAAIAAEAEARIAADAALGNRIDTEASQRKQGDAILGNRIASSTATAIAMGGALVLRDYDFTLSANAGFYEGAQAIAINGAARVSDNAYVTGALGGGLNKRGAVGARVGFAVGF